MELKPTLIGKTREELAEAVVALGHPPSAPSSFGTGFTGAASRILTPCPNLSKPFRADLAAAYDISRPTVSQSLNSTDGTAKWLLSYPDGQETETVHIPETDRGTLCVSSQVGCTLTCKFCHTGTQRLVRNLTAGEILGQFMLARDAFGEWPTPSGGTRMVSNVVFMGMGEPLYNYEEVKKACLILMDGEGLSLSKRRITLSTSGVVPELKRCGEEINVNLAVSLHAVDNDTRSEIMPINKKYPPRGTPRRLPRLPRRLKRPQNHLRIRHAQGHQRF